MSAVRITAPAPTPTSVTARVASGGVFAILAGGAAVAASVVRAAVSRSAVSVSAVALAIAALAAVAAEPAVLGRVAVEAGPAGLFLGDG